jgi:hypothetical protein
MIRRRRLAAVGASALAAAAGLVAVATVGGQAAQAHDSLNWTSISANPDARGIAVPNAVSPQLFQYATAQGSAPLENPDGVVGYYGYNANGTLVPDPTVVQAPGHNVEANKTEPDKNTYLRLAVCAAPTLTTTTAPTSSTRVTRPAYTDISRESTSTPTQPTG